jgi:hypothetical protein
MTISKKKLLQASINSRNNQAILRLAQMDSLKNWSLTLPVEIPQVKIVKLKTSVGLWNFFKSSVYKVKNGVYQFRP